MQNLPHTQDPMEITTRHKTRWGMESPSPPDTGHKSKSSPVLLINWLWIQGSHHPLLGRINLPERLTQLRETFPLPEPWLNTKEDNSGTLAEMEEMGRARSGGRGRELSLYLQVVTNPEGLRTPSFGVFMEASLPSHD